MRILTLTILYVCVILVSVAQTRVLNIRTTPLDNNPEVTDVWDFSTRDKTSTQGGHVTITQYGDTLVSELYPGSRVWFTHHGDSLFFAGEENIHALIYCSSPGKAIILPNLTSVNNQTEENCSTIVEYSATGRMYSRHIIDERGTIRRYPTKRGTLILSPRDTLSNVSLLHTVREGQISLYSYIDTLNPTKPDSILPYTRNSYRWYVNNSILPVALQATLSCSNKNIPYSSVIDAAFIPESDELDMILADLSECESLLPDKLLTILAGISICTQSESLTINIPPYDGIVSIPLFFDVVDVRGNLYYHEVCNWIGQTEYNISLQGLPVNVYLLVCTCPALPEHIEKRMFKKW